MSLVNQGKPDPYIGQYVDLPHGKPCQLLPHGCCYNNPIMVKGKSQRKFILSHTMYQPLQKRRQFQSED